MLIRLVEIRHSEEVSHLETERNVYELAETVINTDHVVRITEDTKYAQILKIGSLKGLTKEHSFTKINLSNGIIIVVVGSVEEISKKLHTKKQMIFG